MSEFVVVFVTVGSNEGADKLAKTLVEEKWAACVNVLPAVFSHYRWQGKLCRDSEALLLIKTSKELLTGLIQRVGELHSYELPEVIALPIVDGSKHYLEWLKEQTRRDRDR